MNPGKIPSLLRALADFKSSTTVFNPYRSPHLRRNLGIYLSELCAAPYSGHLLVGEAPGHLGCALTGIPFTSEQILLSGCHPFLTSIQPSLKLAGNTREQTASAIWRKVGALQHVPAFWNIFPFHPHPHDESKANRRPTRAEIEDGRWHLRKIVEILTPHTIVAVGQLASIVVPKEFPKLKHAKLRHPSHGGIKEFGTGFNEVFAMKTIEEI